MSFYDYRKSLDIDDGDYPFYAIIMAAMRRADTQNLQALQVAFPDTWRELDARYNAPGGLLHGEEAFSERAQDQ